MNAIEFVNIICPEHSCTSCDDSFLDNGYGSGDAITVSVSHPTDKEYSKIIKIQNYKCRRCAYLEIIKNEIFSIEHVTLLEEHLHS